MDERQATIRTAHTDTYKWLFEKEEYKTWRDPSCFSLHNGLFWIGGKPGAGKSTLMKAALQHGMDTLEDVILSFFFSARGSQLEQSAEGMYRSLIHQLLDKIPSAVTAIPALKGPSSHQRWYVELLKELFRTLVTNLTKFLSLVTWTHLMSAIPQTPETRLSFLSRSGNWYQRRRPVSESCSRVGITRRSTLQYVSK